MGELIGGVVGVFILYAVWEFLLFKRVFDDPMKGKMASVIAAYLSASILYGFGSANGGPFNQGGFLVYSLGAFVVAIIAYRRANKIREGTVDGADIGEAFS